MKHKKLKIIFAGTPEFAVPTLSTLNKEGHIISLVITQPDRKSGRGMNLQSSPVKQMAKELDIPIFQPEKLTDTNVFNKLKHVNADLLVVAAYGLIIPSKILDIFSKGTYNVHASLLPSWRGAAPIHRAIEAGDSKIGVTIMSVVPKLDAGDMIRKESVNLDTKSNTGEMTKVISILGAKLMAIVIKDIETKKPIKLTKQNENKVTYAAKIKKSEGKIVWRTVRSEAIIRKINAFNPFPGVFCIFKGKIIKIWQATIENNIKKGNPGKLYVNSEKNNLYVRTTDGAIEIKEIQLEGKRKMNAKEFITANKIIGTEYFL